jgi:biotin transport system substrate-specific component
MMPAPAIAVRGGNYAAVAMTVTAPARMTSRDVAQVAMGAGLVAALGLPGAVAVFGNAVPLTLQTLGVMLCGSLLGARKGAFALLLFVALVAVGLPLLAGGRGGLGVFAGPSAGYLVAWPAAAWVIGRIVETGRRGYRWPRGLTANLLGGIVVVYALGVPVQAWRTGLPLPETAVLAAAFLPGDVLKAVLATGIAGGVHRALPDLLGRPGTPDVGHDRVTDP